MLNAEEGNLNASDGYSCEVCKNRGYLSVAYEQNGYWYEGTKPCKCVKVRRQIQNLKRSGLSGVEKNTFANYIASEPWQINLKQSAVNYSQNPRGKWLFLGGQSGSGKTMLCTATCSEIVMKHNMVVYYMIWRDEAARLKAIINDVPGEYQGRMEELKSVDLLYIDDLFKTGKGVPTQGDINLAFEILNHRYMENLPTIISSELTLDGIVDVDEAVAGRIAERTGSEYLLNIRYDKKKNYRFRGINL